MLTSRETLQNICRELRAQGRSTVFTNGCFDILHAGHVRYLRQAAQLGDALIVGMNADASVRRLKGPSRPVNPQHDRAEVLSALAAVAYVCFFDEDTPFNLIAALQPDVLVKGGDWKVEDIVGADIVRARGGTVCTIPYLEGRSTTAIIQKMQRNSGA